MSYIVLPPAFRKHFLSEAMGHAQLKGIGGPGAPHVLAFDRREDLRGPRMMLILVDLGEPYDVGKV